MKKWLISILLIMLFPVLIACPVIFFSPELHFGMGYMSVKDHLMGKRILLEINGLYKDMDVEEYVVGIMAGTSPADYNIEALKVQAILIRTNLLKEMEEKKTSDAKDLSYEYLTMEDRKALWGNRYYDENERRMEQAVSATAGQVIYYKDELIMALYHDVSIGKTLSAKEELGEDIPYLQSVESSQDVEAKNYMNIIELKQDDLKNIVAEYTEEKKDENAQEDAVKISLEESTENGYVKKVKINGIDYTGEEVMNLFGLSSVNYYIEEMDDGIRFVCLGKGHSMGVSLYGANYMAENGATSKEIIQYYYKDIRIEKYN